MKPVLLIFLLAGLLSGGCATYQATSYVASGLSAEDAKVIAKDVAKFLKRQPDLPPANTTLVLNLPSCQLAACDDALTPALEQRLTKVGYGVALSSELESAAAGEEGQEGAPSGIPAHHTGVPLYYLASISTSPLTGVILRLQYLGVEASRLYPRTAKGKRKGTLLSSGAFAVREDPR